MGWDSKDREDRSDLFSHENNDLRDPFLHCWKQLRASYTLNPHIYRVSCKSHTLYIGSASDIALRWKNHEKTLPIIRAVRALPGCDLSDIVLSCYTVHVRYQDGVSDSDQAAYGVWLPVDILPYPRDIYEFAEALWTSSEQPPLNEQNRGDIQAKDFRGSTVILTIRDDDCEPNLLRYKKKKNVYEWRN